MMKFILDTTPAPEVETQCLVIGAFTKTPLAGSAALTDEASGGALQRLIDRGDVDTGWKSATLLHGLPGVAAADGRPGRPVRLRPRLDRLQFRGAAAASVVAAVQPGQPGVVENLPHRLRRDDGRIPGVLEIRRQ